MNKCPKNQRMCVRCGTCNHASSSRCKKCGLHPRKAEEIYFIPVEGKFRKVKSPELSIVVTVRNRSGLRLSYFFQSLLAQTDREFELIVVDYNSDNLYRNQYVKFAKDLGFRLVQIDVGFCRNCGQQMSKWSRPRALNIGISRARGNYVMTIDIDMIFRKDFIKKLKEELKPNRFIWTKCFQVGLPHDHYCNIAEEWTNFEKRLWGDSLGAIQVASREWFIEVNGYDIRMIPYGPSDTDMWHRAKKAGLEVFEFKTSQALHQEHNGGKRAKRTRRYEEYIADTVVKNRQRRIIDG